MRTKDERKKTDLLNFILQYIEENNGASPSLKDIMISLNMSKATAYRYILALKDQGVISYTGKNTLATYNQSNMKLSFSRLPVLGYIPCSFPEDCREDIQKYYPIPSEWAKGKCYLLRASGDSMIDIGIEEGDLLLIKCESNPYPGQIVVAKTEDGMTLKRYMISKEGQAFLKAENNNYPENKRYIYPNTIEVQGVAIKLILITDLRKKDGVFQ